MHLDNYNLNKKVSYVSRSAINFSYTFWNKSQRFRNSDTISSKFAITADQPMKKIVIQLEGKEADEQFITLLLQMLLKHHIFTKIHLELRSIKKVLSDQRTNFHSGHWYG